MNLILNLFRKNKIYTFHPNACCSGTGAAVAEFVRYKKDLETATECKVVMVATLNIFDFTMIRYQIIPK